MVSVYRGNDVMQIGLSYIVKYLRCYILTSNGSDDSLHSKYDVDVLITHMKNDNRNYYHEGTTMNDNM